VLNTDTDKNTDNDNSEEELEDPNGCYLTLFGTLTTDEATSTSVELANKACAYLLTTISTEPTTETDPFNYNTTTAASRYTSTVFMGIMIDTSALKKSTAGYGQFQALQNADQSVRLDTLTKGQVNVQFGIGIATSIGTADVVTPIGKIQFYIVYVDTPFLLCLADMDRLQIYYNNLRNVVITRTEKVPVVRRFGHPFLLWSSSLQSYLSKSFNANPCYLTDIELRRLHRRFGHPSVEKLQKLLYYAGHETDRMAIEQLTKFCHHCQKFSKSPGRFRFTL